MSKSKHRQPDPDPEPELSTAPPIEAETDEDGFTYEVKPLASGEPPAGVSVREMASTGALPALEAERPLMPENCQFCGARNMIDIRRNYYCVACGHETSK